MNKTTSTRFFLTSLLAVLALAMSSLSVAEPAREIQWDDLLPAELLELDDESLKLRDRLTKLDKQTRKDYQRVAQQMVIRERLAGIMTRDALNENEKALLKDDPMSRLPEAVAFWNEYDELRKRITVAEKKISPSINGQQIRMPGYLLPLEFDGTQVREFLLVPYVGACIHTPPPPRNQMVFVTADKGYKTKGGLYDPVWVEGTMTTKGGTHTVSIVDGNTKVDAGYTLRADKVEPYGN